MCHQIRLRYGLFFVFLISALLGESSAQNRPAERVLIETSRSQYATTIAAVRSVGGRVNHSFSHVDAISAELPAGSLDRLRAIVKGTATISKDVVTPAPEPVNPARTPGLINRVAGQGTIRSATSRPLTTTGVRALAGAQPHSFFFNLLDLNLTGLFANGNLGQNTVVAVIDSGYRPGFFHLESDSSVIGGMDFVGDGLGFSNVNNDGHGTFVAGLISANATFAIPPGDPFYLALQAHAPGAIVNGVVPMLGSAPAAQIYVVRVYGPAINGIPQGAPTSRIIQAMEHVIDLRRRFDLGLPGGVNVRVCNISLGTSTLHAGRSLLDRTLDAMLAADIVPVVSVGNNGPSGITAASPGTANGALTVGALSMAANERVLLSLQFGSPQLGQLIRPFSGTQTAWFSARGPTADGRVTPQVAAGGVANFGMGFGPIGTLGFAGGTSFAAPIVSGVAAVLRQSFPTASAISVRRALERSADRRTLLDGSTRLDAGFGLIDAQSAYDLLERRAVSEAPLEPMPNPQDTVKANLEQRLGLTSAQGTTVENLPFLRPGERREIFYNVPANTLSVTIVVDNVIPVREPAQQNLLFGDDLTLFVHSAKTSAIGGTGDYFAVGGPTRGGQWTVPTPEPGLMRVTVLGSTTNAGPVSGRVRIQSTAGPMPNNPIQGTIENGADVVVPVMIGNAIRTLDVELLASKGWGSFPTSDLDLILVDPAGNSILTGATLRSPERARVSSPAAGMWQIIIRAFNVPSGRDNYQLKIVIEPRS